MNMIVITVVVSIFMLWFSLAVLFVAFAMAMSGEISEEEVNDDKF
jgi:hypothetical protein